MLENLNNLNHAYLALLLFIALTGLLPLLYVGVYRAGLIITGKTAVNSWTRGAEKWANAPLATRMQHAHFNCLENLPLYAGVVLAAVATNQISIVSELALIYFALRLAQTTIHVIGTSKWLVLIRACFYVPQLLLIFYWVIALLGII